MQYYIDIFSPETYFEYLESGRNTSAYSERYRNVIERLNVGDKLICYVTKVSRWVGVLEVKGEMFVDISLNPYVYQIPVDRHIMLPLKLGVPMTINGVLNSLQFSKGGVRWSYKVQNTLNQLTYEDGAFLENKLRKQMSNNSNEYPFSKKETNELQKVISGRINIESQQFDLDSFIDIESKSSSLGNRLMLLDEKMKNISPEVINKIVAITLRKDSAIVKAMKEASGFCCQFPSCNSEIIMKDGGRYVEVAHITAVKHNGKSTMGNLLVLCPNHHKEFDYGNLEIIERSNRRLKGILNGKPFDISVIN